MMELGHSMVLSASYGGNVIDFGMIITNQRQECINIMNFFRKYSPVRSHSNRFWKLHKNQSKNVSKHQRKGKGFYVLIIFENMVLNLIHFSGQKLAKSTGFL